MATKLVICVLLVAFVGCALAKMKVKGKEKAAHFKIKKGYKTMPIPEDLPEVPERPCDNVHCGAGRECIVTEEQEPTCQCVQVCDEAYEHIICGSDGITYPNKCELHRAACIRETKITQVKVGPCEVAPTVSHERPTAPVVCYQTDRNILQKQIVQWLQSKEVADGWFMNGKKYVDIVDEFFTMFDESRDAVIDSTEFMNFVEHNETVRNSTSRDENDEGDNQLLRSMCVDALLTEADRDFDWRLNKEEFETCLTPDFQPGTRMCSLEGMEYPDGHEMQNKCNECVCACGNWVCTANACDGDLVAGTERQEEYDTAEENAMNEKEWKAIMKKLAKVNPEQFPSRVRDLKQLTEEIGPAVPPVNPLIDEIMGEEDFEQVELMAEEVDMDIEQEAATQIEDDPLPAVGQIDEGPVAPLVEQPPRVMERVRGRGGKRGDRDHKHKKGKGKGGNSKRRHQSGGRKN